MELSFGEWALSLIFIRIFVLLLSNVGTALASSLHCFFARFCLNFYGAMDGLDISFHAVSG